MQLNHLTFLHTYLMVTNCCWHNFNLSELIFVLVFRLKVFWLLEVVIKLWTFFFKKKKILRCGIENLI